MMTPTTSVRPFSFAVVALPSYKVIRELPERFVRCSEDGSRPILEHLFEVAEILAESHSVKLLHQLEILIHDGVYYTHSVQVDGRNGFLAAAVAPQSGGPGAGR